MGASAADNGYCDSPVVHGASASFTCHNRPAHQFRIVANCYDGISDYYCNAYGPWFSYGHTSSVTCSAPQRPTDSSMGIRLRAS